MPHQYTELVDRPHYTAPSLEKTHCMIVYRNFQAKDSSFSHIGLGINAILTGKMLRSANIRCDVFPVWEAQNIVSVIEKNPTITHLVIEAPFISAKDLTDIVYKYSNIEFTCRAHSQIAFLQVEPGAIKLIRDYIRLQDQSLNFRISVNSNRLGNFLQQVYKSTVLYLSNLYYVDLEPTRSWSPPGKLIKIGSFGAIRLMKGHISAGAAALTIAANHNRDLEFYISVAREEGVGAGSVLQSIRNIFNSVPFAKLIEVPWSSWSDFRHVVANLDLHMQLSMSETFNITTADAASAGIPTCASEAIDWVPSDWHVDIDDTANIAQTGYRLLNDPHAGQRGLASLKKFNSESLARWKTWFSGSHLTMPHFHLS